MQFERRSTRPRAAAAGILAFACFVGLAGSAAAGSFSEYLFPGGAQQGAYEPSSGLIIDVNGNLWGATSHGGDDDSWVHDRGTLFELTPPAPGQQNWSETTVFNFSPNPLAGGYYTSGAGPLGLTYDGLDIPTGGGAHPWDRKLPLYGWTEAGGSNNDDRNLIFAYGGRCGFQVLHTFNDLSGGYDPEGLTIGPDGSGQPGKKALYGVLAYDGVPSDSGAVFRIKTNASGCSVRDYRLIYAFKDGNHPQGAAITFGPDGALYLGASGSVFRLQPKPDKPNVGWKRTLVYAFPEFAHGPNGRMVFGSDGALYGADSGNEGDNVSGTIYRLRQRTKHNGKVVWVRDTLYSFAANDPQGNNPNSVFFGPDGDLYGITSDNSSGGYGTVFEVAPQPGNPGALPWNMTVLHAFSGTDGDRPSGTLALGPEGAVYGTTFFGSPTYPDDYIHGYAYELVP